jgi:hypothetical protein
MGRGLPVPCLWTMTAAPAGGMCSHYRRMSSSCGLLLRTADFALIGCQSAIRAALNRASIRVFARRVVSLIGNASAMER